MHLVGPGVHVKFKTAKGAYGTAYADVWGQKGKGKTRTRKRIGSLSRLIMNAPHAFQVDHINHDTLDNRKQNLRLCTPSENRRNGRKHAKAKSKYKGVFYENQAKYDGSRSGGVPKKWRAYTRVAGKKINLGYYATEDDAARAYNQFALKNFGEFACLNEV